MIFSKSQVILSLLIIMAAVSCHAPAPPEKPSGRFDPWPELTGESKPWTRMWWMGNAVNREDLALTIQQYAESGIGGVEITPIYGVRGYEDQYVEFLSEEWMDLLLFTIEEAGRHGMGVDINLGTGWPYGGPHITPEYGAKRLVINRYPEDGGFYSPGREMNISLAADPGETPLALIAVSEDGIREDISARADGNGSIRWSPASGNWRVYAARGRNTGQLVKRAAPGGEGLTVDPFSRGALEAYLERFDEAFGKQPPAIRSMFDDSYEVYAASFTPSLFDEFRSRRGYDVRHYLKELSESEDTGINIRIQADFRETLSDLLLEEFTIPWDEWISNKNSISRLQAHGSPGNLLDLYGAAGIPEGEIFGSSLFPIKGFRKYTDDTRNPAPDPFMLKFASSAGNTGGKRLVSSETFTWAGEHFRVSLAGLKPELEQVLLAGVNHIFYHGSSYIPREAEWPGWLFYASVQFNPRNSFWPHLKGMNEYIGRCQSVLQSAGPDNELLIYWPVHDIWHRAGNLDMLLTVHNTGNWLQPSEFYKTATGLTAKGYSADFISGRQLRQSVAGEAGIETAPGASPYRAMVIPYARHMPLEDLRNIVRLAQEGAIVIFSALPSDVPGFHEYMKRRHELEEMLGDFSFRETERGTGEFKTGRGVVLLSGNLQEALEYMEIYREDLVDGGLKFLRRDHGDGKYYYIVNHTHRDIDTTITINATGESVLIMDPQNGQNGLASAGVNSAGKTGVRIQIPSGNALFIKTTCESYGDAGRWRYHATEGPGTELGEIWTLNFTSGGPRLPRMWILEEPEPWTRLPDPEMQYFSGSAEYTTEFNIDMLTSDDYLLCLGDVMESARVWVNGHDAGIIWSNPFNVKIGEYLTEGTNTLRIEVANLMANRIRHMDREGIPWRKFHDINFVSLFYTPFDASDWEVIESGLRGPVRLVPLNYDVP